MNPCFALLKQPLVQFLLIGAVIFAADRLTFGREDDPRRIVIDDARFEELRGVFRDNQGRDATGEEMDSMIIKWTQNEVLYREARLMGLDKGDEMIRQRLILKLRNVLFNRVAPAALEEAELRDWVEQNRARYDKPETFDFEQFLVGEDQDEAEALASTLGAGSPGAEEASRLREFFSRPAANLAAVFGAEDTVRLLESDDQQWVAVTSPQGWHLARVTGRHPGQRVAFEAIRARAAEDYKAISTQRQLNEALTAIADRYDIRMEISAPAAAPGAPDEPANLAMGEGQ